MRILHIIRTVNPESGGPIEVVKQLAKIFSDLNHGLEILSLDGSHDPWVKESALTVHALGPGLSKFGYSRRFIPWLSAHAKEFDVFVINGIWQYHSYAAHKVLISQQRDYYVFTHGMLDPWFKQQYPLKHFKKFLYWRYGEYPVLRDARKVLFTSESEKLLARQSFRRYHCNEQVVNYGTRANTGNHAEQRKLFLQAFPELLDKRFLLFLSRIHPKKGVDMLISAFAEILHQYPELYLTIAGPDQLGWRAKLEQQAETAGIAGKIIWTGMLKGDMKCGAYLCAEAFILPSHQENFGVVVAEALSNGLPVLISDKVNIWQEIQDDHAGLVAADTVEGCLDLMRRWLKLDAHSQTNMRQNSINCFKQRFVISRSALDLLELYGEGAKQSLKDCTQHESVYPR